MSDTAADTATEPTTDTTATGDSTGADTAPDYAAEIAKWQGLARKHEDRAKANAQAARDLEQLRQSTMSDTERAVSTAREEGKAEARRELALSRVDDVVRVAASGRPEAVVEALLEGLDKSRFIGDDGEPDRQAISAWVERAAPPQGDPGPAPLDLGQGVRNGSAMALNGDGLTRALERKLGLR